MSITVKRNYAVLSCADGVELSGEMYSRWMDQYKAIINTEFQGRARSGN